MAQPFCEEGKDVGQEASVMSRTCGRTTSEENVWTEVEEYMDLCVNSRGAADQHRQVAGDFAEFVVREVPVTTPPWCLNSGPGRPGRMVMRPARQRDGIDELQLSATKALQAALAKQQDDMSRLQADLASVEATLGEQTGLIRDLGRLLVAERRSAEEKRQAAEQRHSVQMHELQEQCMATEKRHDLEIQKFQAEVPLLSASNSAKSRQIQDLCQEVEKGIKQQVQRFARDLEDLKVDYGAVKQQLFDEVDGATPNLKLEASAERALSQATELELRQLVDEQGQGISSISRQIDSLEATELELRQLVDEQGQCISSISRQIDSLRSRISMAESKAGREDVGQVIGNWKATELELRQLVDEHGQGISSISGQIDSLRSRISAAELKAGREDVGQVNGKLKADLLLMSARTEHFDMAAGGKADPLLMSPQTEHFDMAASDKTRAESVSSYSCTEGDLEIKLETIKLELGEQLARVNNEFQLLLNHTETRVEWLAGFLGVGEESAAFAGGDLKAAARSYEAAEKSHGASRLDLEGAPESTPTRRAAAADQATPLSSEKCTSTTRNRVRRKVH